MDGVIISLQTDDYGVFDTTLSREFEIAQKSFELSKKDVELILKDSVANAFCSAEEKDVLMEKITGYFASLKIDV